MAGHRELDATTTPGEGEKNNNKHPRSYVTNVNPSYFLPAENKHLNLLHLRNNPLPLPPFLRVSLCDIPFVPPRITNVPRADSYGDGTLGREERVVLVRDFFGGAGGDECLLWV